MAVILRMKWSMIFKDKDHKASEREAGVQFSGKTHTQYIQVTGCDSQHHHKYLHPEMKFTHPFLLLLLFACSLAGGVDSNTSIPKLLQQNNEFYTYVKCKSCNYFVPELSINQYFSVQNYTSSLQLQHTGLCLTRASLRGDQCLVSIEAPQYLLNSLNSIYEDCS